METETNAHGPRIVVGVDGSAQALAAADFAARLAARLGAELFVANSRAEYVPLSPEMTAELVEAEQAVAQAEQQRALDNAVARCLERGVTPERRELTGDPAESLARFASSYGVDLIIVGHRGRNALSRAVLGSVANKLVEISSRPVLVHR